MDNIEEQIMYIVNKKINVPMEFHTAISTALEHKKINDSHKFLKLVTATCIGIILTTGVALAGYNVYEKIWKDPKKYNTYEEFVESLPSESISQEERKNIIQESDAKRIVMDFLESINYNNCTIKKIELKRDYENRNSSYYMIKTEVDNQKGIIIQVNSKTGKITYFSDLEFKSKNINADNISKEKATRVAYEIYQKLNLKDGEFEIYSIQKENKNEWYIKFYKNDNGILRDYENISISFAVINNFVLYNTINIDINEEKITNSMVITQEEAIEIAKNKEKEFSNVEIANITAEQSIEKSNTYIYQLENEIYNTSPDSGGTYLDMEETTRNVWKVLIQHNNIKNKSDYKNLNDYMKENYDKYYYVDSTTGEIIGGSLYKTPFEIEKDAQ